MKLSDIKAEVPFELFRDGFFSALGKAKHSSPQMLTFAEHGKYLPDLLRNPAISCVVTTAALADLLPATVGIAVCPSPRGTFTAIHNFLAMRTDFYWKDFVSQIAEGVSIHPRAIVAEKNVRIQKGARIEAGAIILERCEIAEGVIVRSGTILGGEGFEFHRIEGRLEPIVHAGGVRLGERVEVQYNCTVDRSIFGDMSFIGHDTKIDNLVHIGHRVTTGANCMIAGGATVGGNVVLGDDVWVGPGAVISNGLSVGAGARITLGAVVVNEVEAGGTVSGNFAIEHGEFLETLAMMRSHRRRAFVHKRQSKKL